MESMVLLALHHIPATVVFNVLHFLGAQICFLQISADHILDCSRLRLSFEAYRVTP